MSKESENDQTCTAFPQGCPELGFARGPKNQCMGKQKKNSLRAAKQPPVMKPEIMAFQASSFCRQPLTAQSNVENMPPHTPKLPPVTGARALMVEIAPTRRSPFACRNFHWKRVEVVGGGREKRAITGMGFQPPEYARTNE
jgi:hypothetical protein